MFVTWPHTSRIPEYLKQQRLFKDSLGGLKHFWYPKQHSSQNKIIYFCSKLNLKHSRGVLAASSYYWTNKKQKRAAFLFPLSWMGWSAARRSGSPLVSTRSRASVQKQSTNVNLWTSKHAGHNSFWQVISQDVDIGTRVSPFKNVKREMNA